MIEFSGKGILLDIEGTTSSVRFVYDIMFPYAAQHLADFVTEHWGETDLMAALDYLAVDAEAASFEDWTRGLSQPDAQQRAIDEALRQMKTDAKATGLKQLQGLVWKDGFLSGEMQADVYPDVPPALQAWHDQGIDIKIYSSGSIAAQKLFFAHTIAGDLLHLISGHYDTTIGGKKQAESYRRISQDIGDAPDQWLFLSDIPEELDAAREAGFQVGLSRRPGNAEVPNDAPYPSLTSFDQVHWVDQTRDENHR